MNKKQLKELLKRELIITVFRVLGYSLGAYVFWRFIILNIRYG